MNSTKLLKLLISELEIALKEQPSTSKSLNIAHELDLLRFELFAIERKLIEDTNIQ